MQSKNLINLNSIILILIFSGFLTFGQKPELVIQTGHPGIVKSVKFSPDGKTLASIGTDNTLKLWDISTGNELRTFSLYYMANSFDFSPDGKMLVFSYIDGLYLVDITTGKQIKKLTRDSCEPVLFSPNGKNIICVNFDKTINILNANTGSIEKTLKGHTGSIIKIAISANGKVIASGSQDNTVILWKMSSGKKIKILKGFKYFVNAMSLSPDGKTLSTAGSIDYAIKLWDVKSGKILKVLSGHTGNIQTLAFSPNGKKLVTGSQDDTMRIWNIESGKTFKTLKSSFERIDWVESATFSPNGQLIVTGNANGNIHLWNANNGKRIKSLDVRISNVETTALSPNGKTLATGSEDGNVGLWDLQNGREKNTLSGHTDDIKALAFSKDGKTLASGSSDKTTRIWDIASGKELKVLRGSPEGVKIIAFSPNGRVLAAGSKTIIRLWDISSGNEISSLSKPNLDYFLFSPNGNILASIGFDKVLQLQTISSTQKLTSIQENKNEIRRIEYSPDGSVIASVAKDEKQINLWDTKTGTKLQSLKGHKREHPSFTFSPNGKTLASVSSEIKIWDVDSGRQLKVFKGKGPIAFSPDGMTLASGKLGKNEIFLWDINSGEEIKTLGNHTGWLNMVKFSPDGKRIFSVGNGEEVIKIWEVESGREITQLKGYPGAVRSIATSPDGKFIAAGGWGRAIKIWNTTNGKNIKSLTDKIDWVNSIAFSSDGKVFAYGGISNKIRFWDTSTWEEITNLTTPTDKVNTIAFSPDGETFAWGGSVIKFLNLNSAKGIKKIKAHEDTIRALTFSKDSKMLATSSRNNVVKLWNTFTGEQMKTFKSNIFPGILTFSPDGKTLATGDFSAIQFWNTNSGEQIETIKKSDPNVFNKVTSVTPDYFKTEYFYSWITSDGRFEVKRDRAGKIYLYEVKTKKLLANLIAFGKNDWLVITPEGFFDGTPNAWKKLIWRFNNDTFDYGSLELYFNDFFYPNLLQDILAGKSPNAPQESNLEKKDRRQPNVKIASILGMKKETLRQFVSVNKPVVIEIEVSDNNSEKKQPNHKSISGAKDLRLFRNGSLVKVWRGDIFERDNENGCELVKPNNETEPRKTICKTEVTIVAGENQFTAYAFNDDNVKSNDSEIMINGADSLKQDGTLYVLAIGINKYKNPSYNLNFAVPDVVDIGNAITEQQQKLRQNSSIKQYAKTEVITLTDELATKTNILNALEKFAVGDKTTLPENASEALKTELSKVKQTQPEDALIIYYAGHGVSKGKRFYLLPHNFEGDSKKFEEQSVSDIELNDYLEKVDVGKLLMAIDACQSGQALGGKNEGKAPMNSKGLAQLAYDKGMLVLTAAQSYQAALEAVNINGKEIKHGLLTYALLEALNKPEADKDKNKQLWEKEWFDYATNQVPQMQLEAMKQRNAEIKQGKRGAEIFYNPNDKKKDPNKRSVQTPRIFYKRETSNNPLVIAKP